MIVLQLLQVIVRLERFNRDKVVNVIGGEIQTLERLARRQAFDTTNVVESKIEILEFLQFV